jgi:hypothetical protein
MALGFAVGAASAHHRRGPGGSLIIEPRQAEAGFEHQFARCRSSRLIR